MIDWQRVTLNLRKSCGSLRRVHKITGIDDQLLYRLANGQVTNPKWETALKLLDLHADKCPGKHRLEVLRQ